MANAFNYSNTAVQTTLGGSISGGATSMTVAATTGFPGTTPYVLAVDYGAATEELVKVTGVAGTTLTVERGFSGTSSQSHSLGAVVRHVVNAQDLIDFRTHEDAAANVHGVTGALVGATSTQTLTNKTLTAPTVNDGTLNGTFGGTPAFSGAVGLNGGGALTGTFTGSPTLSGNPDFTGTPTFAAASFSGAVTMADELRISQLIRATRAVATDSQYETRQTGDSAARFFIQADGRQWWGSGAGTVDTNLYRASANLLRTDDDFQAANFPSGAWTVFTPTWSAESGTTTVGDGSLAGRYTKIGRTVFFNIRLNWGSTTTQSVAAANWRFALPVAPYAANGSTFWMADCWIYNSSESTRWRAGAYIDVTNSWIDTIAVHADTSFMDSADMPGLTPAGGSTTSLQPGSGDWAVGDRLNMWGFYEAAA